MKNLSNFKSFLLRAAVVLTTCSLAVSCYDDSDVWNEFTRIEEQMGTVFDRIYAIEDRLNSELGALSAMLNGKLVISDV